MKHLYSLEEYNYSVATCKIHMQFLFAGLANVSGIIYSGGVIQRVGAWEFSS
jgi:hypothetical protein